MTYSNNSTGPWGVQTQDTKVQIALCDGFPVLTDISSVQSPSLKWVNNTPEFDLPKTAKVDNQDIPLNWKYEGVSAEESKLSFKYTCDDLEIISTWESQDLPGPVEHSVILINNSNKAVTFHPTPTISLKLAPESGHKLGQLWIEKPSGHLSDIGTTIDPLVPGYSKLLRSGPYSHHETRDDITWFYISDTTANFGIYGAVEFSGWTQVLTNVTDTVDVSYGLHEGEGKTLSTAEPGTTYEFPTCFVGVYPGDVDDGCNRLRRWSEKYLRPEVPYGITPMLVNNSWGSDMAITEEVSLKMIDDCVRLGIEIFHMDAGWFIEVGNWHTHRGKFPKGLEYISEYTHSKGLKFGLWVGWTQGGALKEYGPDVLSVFNPDQLDWFMYDFAPDYKNSDFAGGEMCLAPQAARDWCLDELRRMVKQYNVDLLEHDQRMVVDGCTREGHGHTVGDVVDVSRVATEGYYEVYDKLREENPNLLFENCVNGGRFLDFGGLKRCHYFCLSDDYHPLGLRRGFYDSSYVLPASMCELYLAHIEGDSIANFKFAIRSTTLGWCTIMIDTTVWTDEQHDAAKREFDIYKEKLRPLIADADVYHVLPRPDGKIWDGMQFFDPKTGNGVLFIFRPQSDEGTQTVKLRGLDTNKQYTIQAEDGSVPTQTVSGKDLIENGLNITLPETNSSDLIFMSEAK